VAYGVAVKAALSPYYSIYKLRGKVVFIGIYRYHIGISHRKKTLYAPNPNKSTGCESYEQKGDYKPFSIFSQIYGNEHKLSLWMIDDSYEIASGFRYPGRLGEQANARSVLVASDQPIKALL